MLDNFQKVINTSEHFTKEQDTLKTKVNSVLTDLLPKKESGQLSKEDVVLIIEKITTLLGEFGKKQNLPDLFNKHLLIGLNRILNSFNGKAIDTTPEVKQFIL